MDKLYIVVKFAQTTNFNIFIKKQIQISHLFVTNEPRLGFGVSVRLQTHGFRIWNPDLLLV